MEELNLKELFAIFWNKKLEMLLIILLTMAVGVIYSYYFITPKYESSTKLVLVQSSSNTENNKDGEITQTDVSLNSKLVSTYSEIIKSNAVLREVINELNIKGLTEGNLKKNISVNSVKATELIEIRVKNIDPNISTQIANKIAEVFSKKIVEIYNISNIYVLDRAEPQMKPCNINHTKDITMFTFIGIVISIIIIFLVNMLDTTIKTEHDIENTTGLLVLTSIPDYEIETRKKRGGKR